MVASDTQAILNERRTAIINMLETNEKVTASDVAAYMGITNVWARKILRMMANEGVLDKIGNNRYTHYVLKK